MLLGFLAFLCRMLRSSQFQIGKDSHVLRVILEFGDIEVPIISSQ
jgi:hypothetical protein